MTTPTTYATGGTPAVVTTSQALHAEYRDIHQKLLKAELREVNLTPHEIQTLIRRSAEIMHELQSTQSTGPKGRKPAGEPKTRKKKEIATEVKQVSAGDDLSDL